MTMDDILSMQGITVAEIGIINDLQKSIKANKGHYVSERRCGMNKAKEIQFTDSRGKALFSIPNGGFLRLCLWERR